MAKIGNIPQVVNDPSSNLDQGEYLMTCESVKEGDFEGQLIYDAVFRVQQPASHQGQPHFEKWFIGTEEDPEAVNPATWTTNAGRMKKCCESMGVPFLGQNPDLVVQQMVGKQVCAKIVHKQSKDGKYTNARVNQWGQPGTMTPHVVSDDNGHQAPVAQRQAPAPMPGAGNPPGVGTSAPPAGMPPSPVQGGQPAPVNPPIPPQYQ